MIIDWPDDLTLAIARRRSVIFLGAGISCQAVNKQGHRPPDWSTFLSAVVATIRGPETHRTQIRRLIKAHDFLTACEVIKEKVGSYAFAQLVQQKFVAPGFKAAPIHDSIIDLDSRIVATPNYDKIFENRINHLQNNSAITKNYYDPDIAEAIRSTSRVVLKAHGTVDNPQKMVFTRTEYAEARHEHRRFYSVLEALAVTHTFLFLGCGFDDPDIRLILEDYAFLHQHAAPHYFVIPIKRLHVSIRPAFERSLNMKFLAYDPQNNHALLKDGIDELAEAVSSKRQELSQTAQW